MTTIADGYFNVMEYGAKGNPYGDDTVAIKAAAQAARATASKWGSKGLYFPPGGAYVCMSPVDFTGISTIKCEGWLVYRGPVNATCFTVRTPSQNTGGNYYFYGLYSLSVPYDQMKHPLIQFSGLRGARVQIGTCNSFVEIYGNCDDNTYASTAYSEFHLGQTYRLEIRDNAKNRNAWVNENQFYGGAIAQLRIGGPWRDITNVADNGSGLIRVTCARHGYATGNMVECYDVRGVPNANGFSLVTVIDANMFDLQNSTFSGTYKPGSGWAMGPPGYPHNGNVFYSPDIEDKNAIVHMQGISNRLLGCRTECTGNSVVAFAPGTFGNVLEQVGITTGHVDQFDMSVKDWGTANFAGRWRPDLISRR